MRANAAKAISARGSPREAARAEPDDLPGDGRGDGARAAQ
jgi:hypothetical protein